MQNRLAPRDDARMALLRYPREGPPGGWWYFQAETRLRIVGESLEDLTRRVCEHRKHKSLAPDAEAEVRVEIERQICSRLDETQCRREGAHDSWVPIPNDGRLLDLGAIVSASRVALEWVKGGAKLVDEKEAQRRREICAVCALNQPATGCKCAPLYRLVEAAVPREKRFEDLHVCAVCACTLKAKVWMPMDAISGENERLARAYPVWCWQNP